MAKYILSIDQGTTSSRAILFDHDGNKVAIEQTPVKCLYPKEGYVESDATDIYISVVDVIQAILIKNNLEPTDIDCVGITNQRETTVVWDKKTGLPVYNAIVWQSRQSQEICEKAEDNRDYIKMRTGLLINPYFSASKIRFILDAIPDGQKRAEAGELMFGTIDTWIIYKLTGGKTFATDVTNASRTMLYNIYDKKWDKSLCDIFDIPMCMLPEVKPCSADYGEISLSNIHITGVAGDQQASLFGHGCINPGDLKNTYGTGCFMLMNIGEKPLLSDSGLLTTVAWEYDGKTTYALEGSVFIGGAIITWLVESLKLVESPAQIDSVTSKVESTGGVYFVPAFVGLGTPYWDDDVRGSVFGLTRGTSSEQFVRAAVEGIALQCYDVFDVMEKDSNIKINSLRVDGGVSNSKYVMQFQSDILDINVLKPKCSETTALGVAYFAGLYTGYWKSIDEIKKCNCIKDLYTPNMPVEQKNKKLKGWKLAVKSAQVFKPENE